MKKRPENKPIIETMINSAALALFATGTNFIIDCCDATRPKWWGFVMVSFGASLEFFKYWGRHRKLWN